MKLVYLIMIVFLSIILPKDTINGKVVDRHGNPINNVFIETINPNSLNTIIVSSDKEGFFLIDNLSSEVKSVKFSHIAYSDKIVDILSLRTNPQIILDLNNIKSEEIVVTGLRTKSFIKDTPVLTHVITSDDIQNSAYSSVKEALEMSLPNVQNVMSSHAGISNEQVKIQGLDNKYLLFLVDGKRVSGEFAGNLDFKMLNLSNVDRIEIVEGGMSSLYGSSAIGGVVNIITKKHNQPFRFNYTYLNDDPMIKTYSSNIEFNHKNFFYGFNFSNQSSDGYDLTPEFELTFPINTLEEYNTNSLNQFFGYNNNNLNIKFNYKTYKNDIYLYQKQSIMILDTNDSNYPIYDYNSYRNGMPKFKDSNYSLNLNFYKNKHLFNLAYNLEEYIKSNYFFNYTEENCDETDCSDLSNLISEEFVNAIDRRESLLLQYNLETKNNLFTLGLEFNDDSYSSYNIYDYEGDYGDDGQCNEPPNFPWDPPDDCLIESIFNSEDGTKYFNTKAFFVGQQWSFISGNTLGSSFRYINSKNFEDNYVYAISYMIKNYKPYYIRINHNKGFRMPAIKELYYNWYGHNPPIIGNPDLVPTTNSYISFSIEKRELNEDFSFELFSNSVNDMIGINYTTDLDSNEVAQYNNYKDVSFIGINSHFDIKHQNNQIKFVYNYTNPRSDNSEALELISKHSFRLNWLRNIIDNKFDMAFNIKYAGEKFIILGSEKLVLDDYFLADLITIITLNKNFKFKFGYKNIFNYKDDRRLLSEGSDFLSTYDPGKRFVLEFKFDFNN